jgi:uncharacterized protein with HEPN domain
MSRHHDWVSLQQMLDHAQEAIRFASGKSEADVVSDRLLQLALVKLVEVVGEAAKRVSPDVQAQFSDIPWKAIVGMRNRLVHGYDEINFLVLWDTVSVGLPSLAKQLEKVLAESGRR